MGILPRILSFGVSKTLLSLPLQHKMYVVESCIQYTYVCLVLFLQARKRLQENQIPHLKKKTMITMILQLLELIFRPKKMVVAHPLMKDR